jgi:hypothetical protein
MFNGSRFCEKSVHDEDLGGDSVDKKKEEIVHIIVIEKCDETEEEKPCF